MTDLLDLLLSPELVAALDEHVRAVVADAVRDEGGRASDLRDIFHRKGPRSADQLALVAEMIVPGEGQDDLGQRANCLTILAVGCPPR